MKKLLAVVLSLCLAFALTACSSTATPDEPAVEPVKVIVVIPGNLGDKSYFDAVAAGLADVEATYGNQIEVKINEAGVDADNWEPAVYDAAELGYDIVITVNFNLTGIVQTVAPQYPDIQFIHVDGAVDYSSADLSNVLSIDTPPAQPSYVAGVIAALKSKNGNLGFVGGMDIVPIHEFLVPFIQGALSINPDIVVQVGYTNDWADAATGKALADTFVENGADVLWAAAGGAGFGIFDTAFENEGVYAMGVDSDQYAVLKDSDPAKAATVLSSLVKGMTPILTTIFDEYFAGTLQSGILDSFLLDRKGSYMIDNENYYALMSSDQDAKVKEATDAIVNGNVTVMNVYAMSAEEIANYVAQVAP